MLAAPPLAPRNGAAISEGPGARGAIPLCTAIATANPARADYYNEPLDPANLDRFALQLTTDGLVHGNAWEDAARVIRDNLSQQTSHTSGSDSADGQTGAEGKGAPIDLTHPGRVGESAAVVDLRCVHVALPCGLNCRVQ